MRLIDDLRGELHDLLEGQEHGIAILLGERSGLPWVYGVLQEFEVATAHRMLWFPHEFASRSDYVTTIVASGLEFAREATQTPELAAPPIAEDPTRSAAERVQAILEWARDHGLDRGGHARLVVVLVPLEVTDEAEYGAFVREFLALLPGLPPWFRRIRVLLAAPKGGLGALGDLPRWTRTITVDLSLAAMTASIDHAAAAEHEPPERRAWATLQAAALAATRGEHAAARTQLHQLLQWIESPEGPSPAAKATLETMALSGLGDVASLEGEGARAEAITWYERALGPAGEAKAALLLLALARRLAELYLAEGREAEAETFHDGAQRLAMLVPDLQCHIEGLRGRASLEARRGATEAAARTLITAMEAARECDAEGPWLGHLRPELAALRGRVSQALDQEIAAQLAAEPAGGSR